ncbi:hypothetical protein GCM10010404_62930 [Nonomuraea africana]|uniref:Polyketide cyclase / dehydrase and lipid transport n=1 Tax=Nonomuraea africana TaxID=46171 RepID=A0ABR9K7D5_9ACTN|nr:hypothetical protein [Nonomuraea africana]MBE1557472.1 hypothetical protein [Nonomuraea africana]
MITGIDTEAAVVVRLDTTIDAPGVHVVEAPHRILWGSPVHGITGIHDWTFREEDGRTRVQTEESWDGEPIRADVEDMRSALEQSLTAWLALLRKTAEGSLQAV